MLPLKNKIDEITNYVLNKSTTAKSYYDDFIFLAKEKDEMFKNYCENKNYKKPLHFEKSISRRYLSQAWKCSN